MSDLTPEALAELRRLAEACPMPDNDPNTLSEWLRAWYEFEDLTERDYPIPPIDAAFIAAASPAVVLGLLDRLTHITEARDNARDEVERLTALVEAVREDARDIARDSGDDKGCYGVDFWAGMCKAAARIDGRIRHALDGAESWPEPACLLHDVSGEDVRGWEMAECTCPTRPLTAAGIIPLPMGLCGSREDHEPHLVPYAPVANGPMWCTADQSKREPYASERRRDEAGTGGAEPS